MFEFELIPGFRASSKLLYITDEEQIFKYKYSRNNIKYYYCYEKNTFQTLPTMLRKIERKC